MDEGATTTQWFPGAHNLSFVNGNFTTIHGSSHVHHSSLGFALLSQHVSHDAIFDSAARYPAGKCYPGTRKEVIQTILSWMNDPSPSPSILWLHGLAGVGKSSIAQTIAEILSREDTERYGGSFFFRHGTPGRQEGEKLFPTLAYQMGVNISGVRDILEEVMNQNHSLPTKTLDIQMQSLIVNPLQRVITELGPLKHTPTIIIDGLDECQGSDSQCEILSLIAESISKDGIPVRFLIVSRPEYWIREAFEQPMLSSLTMQLSLDAPHLDSYHDIMHYLQDGFDKIYKKKARYMTNVEQPWPPTRVIQNLAYHACGQFIYASTVLSFVGASSDYCDPRKQLDFIMNPGPQYAAAFADLDKLYSRILSAFPQLNVLKAVLASLSIHANPYAIQKFLGLDSGDISLALDSLSCVTETYKYNYRPEDDHLGGLYAPAELISKTYFAHRSFNDFLSDDTRSGMFSINTEAFREELASVFFSSLKTRLNGEVDFEESNDGAYKDIYFAIRSRVSTLHAAIINLHVQLLRFVFNIKSIQQETTLLRFLQCVQDILRDSGVSQDSLCTTIQTLLKEKCYPKIVQYMVSNGSLAISDMLIYMTGTTHARLNFITDIPGNSLSRTNLFLRQGKGMISFAFHQYEHPVAEEIYFSSFQLLPSIQSTLDNGGEEHHYVVYRYQTIQVCFQCLAYLACYHNTLYDHLRNRLSRFFDSYYLSDIQDEQDLFIPNFLPFITAILNHDWEQSRYHDLEGLAISVTRWCNRQCIRPDLMDALQSQNTTLVTQIKGFPKYISESFFLPEITLLHPRFREIWVCADRIDHVLSLKVTPPSNGSSEHAYTEEEVMVPDFSTQPWIVPSKSLRSLDIIEIIPDDCAHQYATALVQIKLNSVAKDFYHLLNPGIQTTGTSDWFFPCSPLPYLNRVQPTPAILNALRVICYLGYELMTSSQCPGSYLSDFDMFGLHLLEKYDQNEISRSEMEWFKGCLENWDKLYVDKPRARAKATRKRIPMH